MMEGIMLTVVEVLKDAMMATTFSMVVLGMLFLFPGEKPKHIVYTLL
jgi:hypothetical protein